MAEPQKESKDKQQNKNKKDKNKEDDLVNDGPYAESLR